MNTEGSGKSLCQPAPPRVVSCHPSASPALLALRRTLSPVLTHLHLTPSFSTPPVGPTSFPVWGLGSSAEPSSSFYTLGTKASPCPHPEATPAWESGSSALDLNHGNLRRCFKLVTSVTPTHGLQGLSLSHSHHILTPTLCVQTGTHINSCPSCLEERRQNTLEAFCCSTPAPKEKAAP